MSIPNLSPELMFKYLERLEEKYKTAETEDAKQAIRARITAIDVFVDNCAMSTLEESAADLRIDARMFDLPLLASVLQLGSGEKLPEQFKLDFNEPIQTKGEDETKENDSIVDLEEVRVNYNLNLDYENPEIVKIINALKSGFSKSDNFQKHMFAAVNAFRKKVEVPEEIDDFTIIYELIKNIGLHNLPKLQEYAQSLYKSGLEKGHALDAIIDVKSRLTSWSDESITNMVRTLISMVASGENHHLILDPSREKISGLVKDVEFVTRMASLWPKVNYQRKEKTTGNIIEELLDCTVEKAAGFQIGQLYKLCSLKKRAEMLANRKVYVEKGYPA